MSIVLLQSCSKQSSNEMLISTKINTIPNIFNAAIKSNGIYQLSLDNMENVTITKQASHFRISEAGYDSKTGLMVYNYAPAQDYIGTDEVLLSTSKSTVSSGTGGCSNNSNTTTTITYISIKINVTN